MRASREVVHDVYDAGDECVVFVGDQVLALSARATAALRAVGPDATAEEDVSAALLEILGEPPEGTSLHEATRGTLTELADLGIVRLSD